MHSSASARTTGKTFHFVMEGVKPRSIWERSSNPRLPPLPVPIEDDVFYSSTSSYTEAQPEIQYTLKGASRPQRNLLNNRQRRLAYKCHRGRTHYLQPIRTPCSPLRYYDTSASPNTAPRPISPVYHPPSLQPTGPLFTYSVLPIYRNGSADHQGSLEVYELARSRRMVDTASGSGTDGDGQGSATKRSKVGDEGRSGGLGVTVICG